MKTCSRCHLQLDISLFGRKSSHKDGLQYWCKNCYRLYKSEYYSLNIATTKSERAAWRKRNSDKVLAYERKYRSYRWHNDVIFRIKKNQRNRIKQLLTVSPTSFTKSLGCGSVDLRQHLEAKFTPGMTWDNYGKWEVDHIRPLSSFDLTVPEQFKEAFHYSNLQPLWKKDNRLKSDKWS